MKFKNIYLILLFIIFSCKKEEPLIVLEKMVTIETDLRSDITIEKKFLLEAGLDGYQYAYGSVIKDSNNQYLLASSRFDKFADFNHGADIVLAKFTNDFEERSIGVIQENISEINILSPSLLKINEDHFMLFFSVRRDRNTKIELMFKETFDRGNSWSPPKSISSVVGNAYYVLNNDRVIINNSRIILPVAYTSNIVDHFNDQAIVCLYSDDYGKTWKRSSRIHSDIPLMEPGVVALSPGELLMNIRTREGRILFARSYDNGENWMLQKSEIKSPSSPQTIKRIPKTDSLIMIWNYSDLNYTQSFSNRTPLSLAVSTDKGEHWVHILDIENSVEFDYAYPSILIDEKNIYVNYYKRDASRRNVSLKLSIIPRDFK